MENPGLGEGGSGGRIDLRGVGREEAPLSAPGEETVLGLLRRHQNKLWCRGGEGGGE